MVRRLQNLKNHQRTGRLVKISRLQKYSALPMVGFIFRRIHEVGKKHFTAMPVKDCQKMGTAKNASARAAP
jgi:hypothetical protein